jgi:hypothetical protein
VKLHLAAPLAEKQLSSVHRLPSSHTNGVVTQTLFTQS